MIRNKKADLLNNALGAVLAIGILLIFFFGVREIYKQTSSDEKNARTILDKIVEKINSLKVGENTMMDIVGTKGEWYLTAWDVTNGPDKCFPDNCLCVCPGATKEICQDKGFCRKFENDKIEVVTIQTYTYVDTYEGNEVSSKTTINPINGILISQKDKAPIISLQVSKKEKYILITTNESKIEYSNRAPSGGGL